MPRDLTSAGLARAALARAATVKTALNPRAALALAGLGAAGAGGGVYFGTRPLVRRGADIVQQEIAPRIDAEIQRAAGPGGVLDQTLTAAGNPLDAAVDRTTARVGEQVGKIPADVGLRSLGALDRTTAAGLLIGSNPYLLGAGLVATPALLGAAAAKNKKKGLVRGGLTGLGALAGAAAAHQTGASPSLGRLAIGAGLGGLLGNVGGALATGGE